MGGHLEICGCIGVNSLRGFEILVLLVRKIRLNAWVARSDVGVREDPVRSFPDSPDNLPLTIAIAPDV